MALKSSARIEKESRYANRRTEHDFVVAHRHSALVGFLKTFLPATAIATVMSFGALAAMSYTPLSVSPVSDAALRDGKLIMNSPKMAGFDKENRAFDVNALKAIQNLDTPNVVDLDTIDARLPMGPDNYANVDAKRGTYDTSRETLKLQENVVVRGAKGMDLQLEEADIDMKSGTMVSDRPVKVISDTRNISANAVRVDENGKRIIFRNRVKMTIQQNPDTAEQPAEDAN